MAEETFLPAATFHILLALTSGERHGYALMTDVEQLSNGALRIGPGTLYGSLKRLLSAGWICESDVRPDTDLDDQRRRYYRLTAAGRTVLAAESQRLAQLVTVAAQRRLLPGWSAGVAAEPS
jgi:DNA-binding PadR family transcriptional regulator